MRIANEIKESIKDTIEASCYPIGLKVIVRTGGISVNKDIDAHVGAEEDRSEAEGVPSIYIDLISQMPWVEAWKGWTFYYNDPNVDNHPSLEVEAGTNFDDEEVIIRQKAKYADSKPPMWRKRYKGVVPMKYMFDLRIFSDNEDELFECVHQILGIFGGPSNIGNLVCTRRRDLDESLQFTESFRVDIGRGRKVREPNQDVSYYQYSQELTVYAYYERLQTPTKDYLCTDLNLDNVDTN